MLRLIISLAAVAALGPLAPAPAGADGISAAEDGARKINVSGRQRMLTQRMAKAVCFYRLGIEPERHREMALAAHELYDRSLAALIDGDPDMGLLPERNSRAEVQLRLAEELWADFGPAVKAALAEDDAAAAETVRATNVRLLEQSNKAVSALVIAHGSAEVAPDVAIAINVAGRQRMLSQRMSKEFCSLATGGAGEELRETLAETVALFEASHAGLVDGDPVLGVIPAPTAEIGDQLAAVEAIWTEIRPAIARAMSGAALRPGDIALVAELNDKLLATMNEAVGMYERL